MTTIQDRPEDAGPHICVDCQKEVANPEMLYSDGRCQDCHSAPAVMAQGLRCTCGIEIAKASMCTESDCPHRR